MDACGFVSDGRAPPAEVVNHVARLVSSTEHIAGLHNLLGDAEIDRLTQTEHTHFVWDMRLKAGRSR